MYENSSYLTFGEGMDMAKTRDYMDYLDNEIGIAPANSQEEFQAAETIVEVMQDHGLEPTIQEFDTHVLGETMPNVECLALFLGVLFAGLGGGAIRVVGILLACVSVVLLWLNHQGNNVFANVGPTQRSQNVIGVRRASGEKVVKGSRPIVIVAHYDTPRENPLFGGAFARYQSTLYKYMYVFVGVAAICALVQAMVFLPVVVRVILWVVGLLACVPLIIIAVSNIAERFAGCTTGSNDNKASVAAMLSIINKVQPGEDRVDAAAEGRPYVRRASEDQNPETMMVYEQPVGVRHGKEVIESLGMLPPSCEIVYEEPKLVSIPVGEASDNGVATAPSEVAQSSELAEGPVAGAVTEDEDTIGQTYSENEGTDSGDQSQDQGDYTTASTAYEDDEYYVSPDNVEAATGVDSGAADSAVDSTIEASPSTIAGDSTSKKGESVGERIKGWFGRVKSRFSRDDEPVKIARGTNKEQEADYSEYEGTYEGEDESDQWTHGETEELRPLRRNEIRRRSSVSTQASDQDSAESEQQSLGDIYGQFDHDRQHDTYDDPDDYVDAQDSGTDSALSDAAISSDARADEYEAPDGTQDEQLNESGDATDEGEEEPTRDGDESTDNEDMVSEADEADSWDVTSDDETVPTAESDSDETIPDPIRIDTIQPARRTGAASSKQRSASPANDDSAARYAEQDDVSVAGNDASSPDANNDELAWDQPSVEDEEYQEEYPQDKDSYDEEYEGEYYDEPYAEEVTYERWDGDGEPNVYDDAAPSQGEGGFKKFVGRVKGLFKHGHKQDERPVEEDAYRGEDTVADTSDESQNAAGYDEQQHGDAEGAVSEEEAHFEEVRSEEYLPSDDDALYDDVDDDYEFPQPSDSKTQESQSASESGRTDEQGENHANSSGSQFDTEDDDTADILPKDTTGLDALLDDDYAESGGPKRKRPEPIDDPTWGKSSYEPPVSRASIARRAALLDLPNPSAAPVDPLDDPDDEYDDEVAPSEVSQTNPALDDTAPDAASQRGDSEDAQRNRRDNWKGGAALRSDLRNDDEAAEIAEPIEESDDGDVPATNAMDSDAGSAQEEQQAGASDEEMQDAILELGDDLLLSHDIWFVAVGASSVGHAGMKSFLANFRKDIRGAFLINLDCIGAGVPVVLTREGLDNGKRSDRRSLRLFQNTAKDLQFDVQNIDYGWRDTDATPAMRSRVRSITIMGMDENGLPALSHTVNDVPMNVNPKQVSSVVRVICEFIRRS